MTQKSHLKLIKSEPLAEEAKAEEVYEKSFSYDLALHGTLTLSGESKEEVAELCRLGEDIVNHTEFRQELAQIIYDLIAERLEVSTDPLR
jgi:hypothetical protein